ncbi:MAG: DNA mismatch repair protein MutS [Oscillospiraceae bacterium]
MAQLSPMMRQFMDIKEKNPDKLLFFRVGDFYEMFFDDAILVSKELELTLTGKECGLEERAPMCGVPHHAVETYVARLIAKGYKVAICDQVEDPALAKGLVERQVTRIVTPGTVIESNMLQDDRNNFIASIYLHKDAVGLCFADVSTGTAYVTVLSRGDLPRQVCEELSRYSPSEVLFNEEILSYKEITNYIKNSLQCSVELLSAEDYKPQEVQKLVQNQFSAPMLQQLGDNAAAPEYFAVGALIAYLGRTQTRGVERLKDVSRYQNTQYMYLSPVTRSNLEIVETMRGREKKGSLLWVLDKTGTAMGKRLMRLWLEQPLMNAAEINGRLDGVQDLFENNVGRQEVRETLSRLFDLERLMTRAVYGSATPREVAALADSCAKLPGLLQQLVVFASNRMQELAAGIDPLEDVQQRTVEVLADELPASLKDGGVIRGGYNDEVDELRGIMHGGKGGLADIEARLREETGIRTLKIGYNRVFGYYIEVSKSFVNQVPAHFIRKQTLTGGERYITEELKTLENKILGAGERLSVLESELFTALLQDISAELPRIQRTAASVAELDVLVSFAQVAMENNYVRPAVDDTAVVDITEGRHPVVEKMQKGALFVPNDTHMDCEDNRMQIITGPNMAGKSTYMRQTAIIILMAQVGSFVPATACRTGICDALFTRVGASDDLSQGQSTFMVEMTEVAEILQKATPKSFVILDEIGRGTSTFDGMSIAQSVVEYMAGREWGLGCKTMFATHYHELTEMENSIDGVKNYNIAVKKRGDNITFLRRIVRGPADDSYGIQVAKLAGLPDQVTDRAKQVLKVLEASGNKANRVTQLDFEAFESLNSVQAPSEMMEKLEGIDPETLTPLEALNFVYELKKMLSGE